MLFMSVLMLKAGGEATNYVSVNGKTYFCHTVKQGILNMNLKMNDGTTMRVPLKKVDAYCCKGRMFERLPVVCKGAPANCTALMEYITSRNGYRLYKHCEVRECSDIFASRNAHQQFELYVFKDGKLYLPVTKEIAASVLPFFGIPVN